ncbi:YdeI family protein [Sphingobacterium sp. SG20118]|uniref:YdeI/OmpD-associated family protein n=1 Tax=Sphingobacterium sp. SG20118 TaxID=3367156 RepID=UPI0037DFC01C
MKIALNTGVDQYLMDGCMRCKYGGTPQCKVNDWRNELELLRQIVLESGLKEEIKWGAPVYTHHGKNIVAVAALKHSANISFFKGVLLLDSHKILTQQGNLQSDRIIKFTNTKEIERLRNVLISYLKEAISIEENGQKVAFKKNPEPIPDELLQAFEQDANLEAAFYRLTPGRQRGYIIHFSQPKQSQTRVGRIEKNRQQILNGVGLNDRYTTITKP